MTELKTEKKKLSSQVKFYLVSGVLITLAVIGLYVATALTLIGIGLWAPVVWIWFGLFTFKLVLNNVARLVVAILTNDIKVGKTEGLAGKLDELAKAYSK